VKALFPIVRRVRRPLVVGESLSEQVQRLTTEVARLTEENARLVAELGAQKALEVPIAKDRRLREHKATGGGVLGPAGAGG